MGAAAIPLALAGASVAGSVYSAKKQSDAAKKQQASLEKSQSLSREDAERGKTELRQMYGDALWTIEAMTPEIISQFQEGQLTTQQYLTDYNNAANQILGDSAASYKAELLGSAPVLRDNQGRAMPMLSDPSGDDTVTPTYGLSGAELALNQAREIASQDITQGREAARQDLTQSALRGERGLVDSFEQAREQFRQSNLQSGRDIQQAAGTAQDRLTQAQRDSGSLLRRGQTQQLNLLRGGQRDMQRALTSGYEDAISAEGAGYDAARQDLNNALQSAQGIRASTGSLSPYSNAGAQATELELALSGAAGPGAQAEAYANFQESPGQKFLRERQEQSLLRNAAATGGLQGGNVLTALQEQAQGIASQDLQRQVANLQSISGRGLQAAGQIGSLQTQAGIARGQTSANINSKLADLSQRTGMSESQLRRGLGEKLAAMQGQFMGAESQLRQGTQNQQLAGIRDTAGNLANIDMQTAGQVAGLDQATADRLYQSLQQQGLSTNQINQVLGANLAGLETSAASQLANNQMQTGGVIGNMRMSTGQQLAGMAGQAGQQQAQNTSNLGTNLANLNDRTNANIVAALQNRMNNRSQLQSQLGTNLGNISVGQGSNTLNFANQLAQSAGMRDIAQANQVTGLVNSLGNLASSVDWGSLGSGQQPTGQSAISDETFLRGTNQWGSNP
jgi:hypothetical protein